MALITILKFLKKRNSICVGDFVNKCGQESIQLFTTRRYTNTRLPYLTVLYVHFADSSGQLKELVFPKALDLDRPKRARTMFSGEQLKRLEEEFHRNQYLVGVERAELAARLGLSETQVLTYHLIVSS